MAEEPRTEQYDAIIIGAGQSGGPLSTALAGNGFRTALIERAYLGGTCVNYGCTPTKTMIASARVAHLAGRARDYGVRTGELPVDMKPVDMKVVRRRKRQIVEDFRKGNRGSIESADGVDLLYGKASFTAPKTLRVELNEGGLRYLNAPRIFIDTGTSPRIPGIDGLDDIEYLTNVEIMELAEVPDHLLVLGGGYVGVEFAQMMRRFGAEVTIVQRGDQLLQREDADAAAALQEVFEEEGITVLLESKASAVTRSDDGLRLTLETSNGERTVHGSHLLLAAGRIPNTASLNLQAAGVETGEKGEVKVDDRLETNVPGIYAMGDVKGGPAFTHISYDDFRVLRTNLLEGGDATIRNRPVPYCIFTDPELARIGLSETQARETTGNGRPNVRVAKMPMSHVARALEKDETRGFMKAIVDGDTDQILGFTMLGINAGEIMSLVQIAMRAKLPYTDLQNAIFTHPTVAEGLNNLFGAWQEE